MVTVSASVASYIGFLSHLPTNSGLILQPGSSGLAGAAALDDAEPEPPGLPRGRSCPAAGPAPVARSAVHVRQRARAVGELGGVEHLDAGVLLAVERRHNRLRTRSVGL